MNTIKHNKSLKVTPSIISEDSYEHTPFNFSHEVKKQAQSEHLQTSQKKINFDTEIYDRIEFK